MSGILLLLMHLKLVMGHLDTPSSAPLQQAYILLICISTSETTATTLSGLMTQLLTHPEAYRKLVGEIRSTLKKEGDITLDALKNLPYLNACFKESMRLCPATPFTLPRVVPKGGDTVCGAYIAGGVSVTTLELDMRHLKGRRPVCLYFHGQ